MTVASVKWPAEHRRPYSLAESYRASVWHGDVNDAVSRLVAQEVSLTASLVLYLLPATCCLLAMCC